MLPRIRYRLLYRSAIPLGLFMAYRTNIDLARAILLMGVTSVLGGTLWEVIAIGNRRDAVEWIIFIVLGVSYAYRLLVSLLPKP